MKKSIQNLMMAAAMICGTMSMTSCDEFMESIFGEWDRPTPATPTPNPTPDPTPTPEELNAKLVAEAQVMVEEARKEGSVISFTYTVDGVEKTAEFKRVGDGYQLQQTSGTRGDSSDELTPVLLDMDGEEDLDDDDDDDDGEPETGFENLDGGDDDEDLDDDSDPSVDPDKLEWGDSEESWVEGYDGDIDIDDGGEDVDDVDADDEDKGAENAGTRSAWGSETSKKFMMLCFRDGKFIDHGQMILNYQEATFTAIQAVERVSYKTRADGTNSYKTIGFSGNIVVNGKLFTLLNKYDDNVAATRATESSKFAKGRSGESIKITGLTLQKPKKIIIDGGKKHAVYAQIMPMNARVKTVTWTSNNKDRIIVNNVTISDKNKSTCKITTKFGGSCTLTCMATGVGKKNKKASYKIYVKGQSAVLTLTPIELELTVGGESKKLTAKVSNVAPGEQKTVTWKSNNKKIATVENGVVKPVSKGETEIICTTVGKGTNGQHRQVTCKVNVKEAPAATVAVTGVTIKNDKIQNGKLTLTEGETATLTATVAPENASDKTVTWSVSDNDGVISFNKETGVVTAVKAGTATITVKTNDGGYEATCTVTVKAAEVPDPTINPSGNYENDGDPLS